MRQPAGVANLELASHLIARADIDGVVEL